MRPGHVRAASVATLAATLANGRVRGDARTPVTGITYDSRQVQPGDLFAALVGADVDGHQFVDAAIRRGATAFLVEREQPVAMPQLIVNDSRAALALVAASFFAHPSAELGVVGITGTDGKTTTAYLADGIFRSRGYRTGMIGTIAVRVGDEVDEHETRQTTPESVDVQRYLRQMVEHKVEWAMLEATSHGLAMHRLDGIRFAIAAVTNITHEHLDYHRSVEAYRRAKAILFERTAGPAIINLDDPGACSVIDSVANGPILRYSLGGRSAELSVSGLVSDGTGSRFDLNTTDWGSARFTLPLIGQFNVANALCAAGIALAAGISLPDIARALASPPVIPGRMQAIVRGQPFGVVVDYAHTPDSLTKVLTLLRSLYPGGKLLTVFGSAGERDVEKRDLQGAVAATLADFSVFTSEDPRYEDPDAIIDAIASGAMRAGGREGVAFVRVTDRRDAIQLALARARPGDCVLLAGKGHEGSIIWGREKVPWHEAGVATALLTAMGYTTEPGDG
ncbi:MAG: UDP-N-acetylmuramoyl-L-alanyl-D-glutamate--2,6-diaminopimelate ligase [Chloroflexota bacterium]|nr:UDP-N-acetylmuramoyl-L-alanyl-D-glutamate--2,6-diaminopimelate ligase [Chloroflexota bacterium]